MKLSSMIGHTVEILAEIDRSSHPPDSLFATFFRQRKYLGSRDRRFIAETAYGVLRHRRRVDMVLEMIPGSLDGSTTEGKSLLRVSVYLLVIVHDTSATIGDFLLLLEDERAKERFASVFAAIASNPDQALPTGSPSVEFSFPDWMSDLFAETVGREHVPTLLAALNEQAPIALRVNTLKTTPEECRTRLESEGVHAIPGRYSPFGLLLAKRVNVFGLGTFKDGWFEVQDEGSQLLPLLVDPKPTDRILDLCAGAGGKTLALSALMKNRGEIVATDVSELRLKELRRRSRRAGAGNIRVREDLLKTGRLSDEEPFDIVFVDAPCSGVGTIRRNPGMKWSVSEQTVTELAAKQREILNVAAAQVAPGGRLVYATCSLFKQENERVVDEFLAATRNFSRIPLNERLSVLKVPSASYGEDLLLNPISESTDGFYCAMLRHTETPYV